MNTVLTLVNGDAGQDSRLRAAIDLTHALCGHLICLETVSEQALVEADLQPQDPPSSFAGSTRGWALKPAGSLHERLLREDIEWEIFEAAGDGSDCLRRRSGLADIVVLSCEHDTMRSFAAPSLASRLALQTHKPILAMPEDGEAFDLFGRALIAWDGSPASMGALTAAVPLLKWSTAVTILEVETSPAGASCEEAVAYLGRREIHAYVQRFPTAGADAADMLQDSIVASAAAYCVMGAHGHSPLYDAIVGNVTRSMLSCSRVPLLIAR